VRQDLFRRIFTADQPLLDEGSSALLTGTIRYWRKEKETKSGSEPKLQIKRKTTLCFICSDLAEVPNSHPMIFRAHPG